jgi:protein CMS1
MGENIDFTETWGERQRDVGSFDVEEGSDDGDTRSVSEGSVDEEGQSRGDHANQSREGVAAKTEKLSKKKRKFSEMKLKRQAMNASEAADASHVSDAVHLSAEQQAATLNAAFPEANFGFTSDNFVALPPVKKSESSPLVQAIMSAVPSFKKTLKTRTTELPNGSPMILIVCSSAVRAADVINTLSKHFHCIIAKLFAKHFKLQEQVEFLTTQSAYIAVGTPNRLAKLVEYGALRLSHVSFVLLDMHEDSKAFNILTLPDIRTDSIDLITTWIAPLVRNDKLKMSLVSAGESKPSMSIKGKALKSSSLQSEKSRDKYHHPKKTKKL